MSDAIKNQRSKHLAHSTKAQRGHSKFLPIMVDLTQPGRLRVGHLQTLFAISHAAVYARIKAGIIPRPDGYDGVRPYWNNSTILHLLTEQ